MTCEGDLSATERIRLFGSNRTTTDFDVPVPDITRLAGVRQFIETDGPGRSSRLIQVDTGSGLRVDVLPDRCCDIGLVWCNDIPFGWAGPLGVGNPRNLGDNTNLSGLMGTCGFEHIRQPEEDRGRSYPLHGRMAGMPTRVLSCGVECGRRFFFARIIADATQWVMGEGAVRLERELTIPLGCREITLTDRVSVLSGAVPLMAMYHFNFGFPLVGPDAILTVNGVPQDVATGQPDISTTPVRPHWNKLVLRGAAPRSPVFTLGFDGKALPWLQTLRKADDGMNLLCIEPATHDRKSRSALFESGLLKSARKGHTTLFRMKMTFDPGHDEPGGASG